MASAGGIRDPQGTCSSFFFKISIENEAEGGKILDVILDFITEIKFSKLYLSEN